MREFVDIKSHLNYRSACIIIIIITNNVNGTNSARKISYDSSLCFFSTYSSALFAFRCHSYGRSHSVRVFSVFGVECSVVDRSEFPNRITALNLKKVLFFLFSLFGAVLWLFALSHKQTKERMKQKNGSIMFVWKR